jgi:hypothetical protein
VWRLNILIEVLVLAVRGFFFLAHVVFTEIIFKNYLTMCC